MNKPCTVFVAARDGLDWSALGSLCSKLASGACSLVVGGGGMAEGKKGKAGSDLLFAASLPS